MKKNFEYGVGMNIISNNHKEKQLKFKIKFPLNIIIIFALILLILSFDYYILMKTKKNYYFRRI